jgi:DNA mismatch repair protein MutS2
MLRKADASTLRLIDEIGDGTDPDEGAALAIATLERLLESGAAVIATTHYGKVKTFALETVGVSNASMVFDDDNNQPLYRLLQGTAGRSRGIETARRLGFCAPVVERAASMIGEETFRMERILSDLESQKIALEREHGALLEQSEALNRLITSYGEKEQELREYKDTHREQARKEAEEILHRARKEIEAIVKNIRESQAAKQSVRESHGRLKKMLDEVSATVEKKTPEKAARVRPDDRVSLSPSGEPSGVVLQVDGDKVIVDIGGKKITVNKELLYAVTADDTPPDVVVHVDVGPLETTTVDVRGHDRADALDRVDELLDRAVLNGVSEIKIIHGIGERVLLDAIKKRLNGDRRVKSHRPGGHFEGGVGVTFVLLK